jgi:hypothetical protein
VVKISIGVRSMSSQEMTSLSEIGQHRNLYAVIMYIPLAVFTLRMPGVGKLEDNPRDFSIISSNMYRHRQNGRKFT